MLIPETQLKRLKEAMTLMERERLPWWRAWREIADFYIPKRYMWLLSADEQRQYLQKNPNIIDGTGTTAGRVLAAGMMNGITSPTRPWFKLRLARFGDTASYQARQWLDEVERRMLTVMAESNFYNALAVMYLDLVFFGSAAVLIYADTKSVIRCYNCSLGEFYFGMNARQEVDRFARKFYRKVYQVVEEWGLENCSEQVQIWYNAGGAGRQQDVAICHVIEPNYVEDKLLNKRFTYREVYWEEAQVAVPGSVLAVKGYYSVPGIFPRWEVTGNDSYGTSPGMDALGDVIQLQSEHKEKGRGLAYMNRPPTVLDAELAHRPTALLPGGQTFVRGANSFGAKPVYQVTPPIGEITLDIRDIQGRIREIFHNDLFKMISQLETVRSATEIDARKEEKLIMLGPVLDRFKSEGLDPAIDRTYTVMEAAGLLPPPPPDIANEKLEIQYVSILASAQSAVGVIPTERWVGFIGQVSAAYPKALNLPNWEELLADYGRDLGVKAKHINTPEKIAELAQAQDQAAAEQNAAGAAQPAAAAAKLLSETDVGGGMSALQMMAGG